MKQISEEYRTGLEQIDAEHIKLLDLTDEARKLFEDENMLFKCADIRRILAGLQAYTIEHFAHDTHDEEHNQACQCIAEQYGRTGSLNRAGRAHEQADANRTAQSDHFNVAGF